MLLAFLLTTAPLQTPTTRIVSLSLGAMISDGSGGQYRYESVEDTYLNREFPDKNAGGEFILVADHSKTILIRFGDLERALGSYRRVRKATLFLTPDSPTKPQLASISSVTVPWGEGPLLVVGKPFIKPTGPGALPAPAFSATWKDRRAGTPWSDGGARGEADIDAISGAKQTTNGDEIAIQGLEKAVQHMADNPLENNGFALSFTGPCSFVSSQDPSGRPHLELEVENSDESRKPLPDLAVTRIERTPTYDVVGTKTAPAKGEVLTYTAHVRNEGQVKSIGFIARWTLNERVGSSIDYDKPLEPGAETTLAIQLPYEPVAGDHRGGSIKFSIAPKGGDADPRNNAVQVNAGAKSLGLTLDQSFEKTILAAGFASVADWAQVCLRAINETYLPHSRFSFAPSGILERFRLQSLLVVPDADLKDQRAGEDLDAMLTFSQADAAITTGLLGREFARRLGLSMGLSDLSTMNVGYQIPGGALRTSNDRFAGALGGGDTRFDGGIPGFFVLPYEPFSNPIFDVIVAEPTGLYSATDAYALNSGIDTRGKVKSGILDQPALVLIKAVSLDGGALTGAELSFFQTKNGKVEDSAPAFTVVTDATGTATLPNRPGGAKPNPFGNLDPSGSNGLLVVRSSANGASDVGWLKAWQLADAFHRTGRPAPEFELRFNLPTRPLDLATNLAEGRPVKDSGNDLPAKLAALVDGNSDSHVALPIDLQAWVEVDLGRDRFIGEVQLVTKDQAFWDRFDILAYATGQEVTGAAPWMKELDWEWSTGARGDKDSSGGTVMHYRGGAGRFRYIRIVNRGGAKSKAGLAEIRVIPVKAN